MSRPDQEAAAGRRRAQRIWSLRLLALAALAAGVVFYRPLFQGNFGVVERGLVYRCAQPKRKESFRRLIRDCRLATVLNLRGGSVADPWYAEEVRLTRAYQVDFYDFPLSPVRRPARWELLALIDLLGRCRYPLLIHCKWGSDRTGLASCLYRMVQLGEPPSEALRAFSLEHGHIPLGGPQHLQEPLVEYDAWLKAQHLPHTPARFREWVVCEYQAADPPFPVPPLRPGPRPQIPAKPAAAMR